MSDNSRFIANKVPKPSDNRSVMEKLAELPPEDRIKILDEIVKKRYPDKSYEAVKYDWSLHCRADQTPEIIGTKDWRIAAWISGRGYGKLNPLNTDIYTDRGWKTIGTLEVGDKVFNEQGDWHNVVEIHPTQIPEKAYRFWFNDGTYIDSGSEHYWWTWTHQNRKQYLRYKESNDLEPPNHWIEYIHEKDMVYKVLELDKEGLSVKQISNRLNVNHVKVKTILEGRYFFGLKKTTQQIVDTFYQPSPRKDLEHCIFNTLPLKFEYKELPIPPFLLAYWLGNGSTGSGDLSAHQDDIPELIEYIQSLGFQCKYEPLKDSQKFSVLGLAKALKKLEVLHNKKTPEIYLTSSIEQRLELLKGFFTSDGGVDAASCASYSSSRKNLAEDVEWLLISLGMKVTKDERIPTYTYKGEKLKGQLSYRIKCTPITQLFRLKRKAERLSFNCGQMFKRYHRMIERYEEIEPTEMRCITVDSPNGCFLIGKQLLPTSNTRVGSEFIRHRIESGEAKEIGIIGPTANDVVGTMINGPSGILACSPPWDMPKWSPTYKTLTWENHGARLRYYSADSYDRIRGLNCDTLWVEELCAAQYGEEAFKMGMFALRLGNPKCIITSTPKPYKYLIEILQRKDCYTICGSSHENASNIDLSMILESYEGTRLGEQEIYGKILWESENALWKMSTIERYRCKTSQDVPELLYIIVAVDPAVSVSKTSAETGISVVGYGLDGHFYVLYAEGFKYSPIQWAEKVVEVYDQFKADRIVVEVNNGGDLVVANVDNIRPHLPVYKVHATRGKVIRAEPIATLTERGLVHHVGYLPKLEDQLTNFPPEDSKTVIDCAESFIWGVTALLEMTARGQSYSPVVAGNREKLLNYQKSFSR